MGKSHFSAAPLGLVLLCVGCEAGPLSDAPADALLDAATVRDRVDPGDVPAGDLGGVDARPDDARGGHVSTPDAVGDDAHVRADGGGLDGTMAPDGARSPDMGPAFDGAMPDAATLADAAPPDAAPPDAASPDALLPDAALCAVLGEPVPLYEPGDGCPEGTFALGDGRCSAFWDCQRGWVRAPGGYGCDPPPVPECGEGSFALPNGECAPVWTCPPGWRRGDPGVPHHGCEPVVSEGCGADELPRLDGSCHSLGLSDCGDTPFGPHVWPPETVFVDPAAPPAGADGTEAHPYPSFDDALEQVGAAGGGQIALAAGEYDGIGTTGELSLSGRCADLVRIHGLQTVPGGHLVARDLTVIGPTPVSGAGALAAGGHLELERVKFEAGLDTAFAAAGAGARVDAIDVLVDGAVRLGAVAQEGGAIGLVDTLIRGAGRVGLVASEGSEVDGVGVVVEGTRPGVGLRSSGLIVSPDAVLALTDSVVQNNATTNVIVTAGGHFDAERVLIRRPRFDARSLEYGWGLEVSGSASLADVVIAESTAVGLFAGGDGEVVADRLVVRGSHPAAGPTGAVSVGLFGNSGLDLRTGAIAGHEALALYAESDSAVQAIGLRIADARPPPGDDAGAALAVGGGLISLVDSEVVGAVPSAIRAYGAGTVVRATRTTLRDPVPIDVAAGTTAVEAYDGASVILQEVYVARFPRGGLAAVGPGTSLDLHWVALDEILDTPGADTWGVGISIDDGAHVSGADVSIRGADLAGLVVRNGSTGVLERVRVSSLRHASPVRENGGAIGILGSSLTLDRFEVDDALATGVIVSFGHPGAPPPRFEANDGLVTDVSGPTRDSQSVGLRFLAGDSRVTDAVVARVVGMGVAVSGGATLDATGLTVRETLTDLEGNGGVGLSISSGASLTGARVDLRRNAAAGLTCSQGAVTVSSGVIDANGGPVATTLACAMDLGATCLDADEAVCNDVCVVPEPPVAGHLD